MADDTNIFVLMLVFWDDYVGWGMVLLVTHQNMGDQQTFAREERYSHLHGFTMGELRIHQLKRLVLNLFFQLIWYDK